MSSYIKNILHTFAQQLISLILGLLIAAIIARYLGVENRGIYALIILLPTTLFTFLNLGLSSAIVFIIGNGNNKIEEVISSIKLLSSFLIPLSVLIGTIAIILFKGMFFKGVESIYLYFSLLLLPALLFINFIQAIYIGNENFKLLNKVLIIQPILFLVLLLLNLALNLNLDGVLTAELLTNYVILVISYFYMKKLYVRRREKAPRELVFFKLKYGLKNHAANIVSFFEYRLDLLMVSYFLDIKSVGAYVIAINIAEKIWMVASSVSGVLFARIVNLDNRVEKIKITVYSAKIVFIVSLVIAIALYYLSNILIILLFGEEYRATILPFVFLLPGVVLWSVVKVYASFIAGEGKPEYNVYVSVISVIINFILNLILIPNLGLKGAALATTIAYTVNFILRLYVFKRMSASLLVNLILPTKEDVIFIRSIYKKGVKKNEK